MTYVINSYWHSRPCSCVHEFILSVNLSKSWDRVNADQVKTIALAAGHSFSGRFTVSSRCLNMCIPKLYLMFVCHHLHVFLICFYLRI